MTLLHKYSDILGLPGKGFHRHAFGFAIGDFLGTILITHIISKKYKYSFLYVFVILMMLAIFLHKLFNVKTRLNVLLGLS